MPYFHLFLWDGVYDEHLARHGVTPAEFEEVVLNAFSVELRRSSDRLIAFGHTATGRKLACVYEPIDDLTCYPITAFDVP